MSPSPRGVTSLQIPRAYRQLRFLPSCAKGWAAAGRCTEPGEGWVLTSRFSASALSGGAYGYLNLATLN